MEAIPLCILLRKPYLYSLKQPMFILIQIVISTCVLLVCYRCATEAILGYDNIKTLQGGYNKNIRWPTYMPKHVEHM